MQDARRVVAVVRTKGARGEPVRKPAQAAGLKLIGSSCSPCTPSGVS